MRQLQTVDPSPLEPRAPVVMPPSWSHLLDVASPPAHHGRRLRALAVAMALRGGGEERLYTRLGLVGGGPIAFAQPEHARAASTQNSGRVGPREPFQQQRNPRDRAVAIEEYEKEKREKRKERDRESTTKRSQRTGHPTAATPRFSGDQLGQSTARVGE